MERGKYILLIAVLAGIFVLRLLLGSVHIPLSHLFDLADFESVIVLDYRLPRALTAIFAGMGLAVCGLLMQTIFRNPLAGPFVLGVSSGASLMVAIVILASGTSGGFWLSSLGYSGAAILGSMGVMTLILIVSLRFSDNFTLLIFGLMLGYIFGALQGLTEYFGEAKSLKSFVVWGMGSFAQVRGWQLILVSLVSLATVVLALLLHKKLDFYNIGDDYAALEGIRIKKLKIQALVLVGVCAGVITAYCGPIAFLGIAVPHLASLLLKSRMHNNWIAFTALTGAILAVFCDLVAELPFLETTFPINVITSVVGAPVVIWVLMRKRRIVL
jgi:iron complex transport system permease protein